MHSSPYKGGTHQWSNRHHFAGGTPADLSHWTTFVNAVVAAEKLCMATTVTYVEAVCYEAGSDLPVHTITLSGTGARGGSTGEVVFPLQTAALIRWSTDQRTSKNHPIYLFSYMHSILSHTGSDYELVEAAQLGTIQTYAAAWVSGFSDGTNTLKRAGPNGAVALGSFVPTHVTHRDFVS